MNKRILLLAACALLLTISLLAGCASTKTVMVTTTVGGTGPADTVPPEGTNPPEGFDAGVIILGGGTFVLPGNITTVLKPTGGSFPTTVTETYGTVTTAILLTGPPPLIPHEGSVQGMYGMCFTCHQIPAGHEGRIANQDLCGDCHKQGPVILPP